MWHIYIYVNVLRMKIEESSAGKLGKKSMVRVVFLYQSEAAESTCVCC